MSAIDYRLRTQSPWNWRDFDTVRLEISVGQDYHEGTKLKTATEWARDNFRRAVIILGDTIQGYNLAIANKSDLQTAFDQARAAGDDWLVRNRTAIAGVEVTRWDDWKSHEAYQDNETAINRLYKNNATFRDHIDDTVDDFWWRRNAPVPNDKRFHSLSRDFLLEESAVFATAYGELGGISAYPGTFLQTWQMFVENDIDGAPLGLKNSHWTRLQFKRRHDALVA